MSELVVYQNKRQPDGAAGGRALVPLPALGARRGRGRVGGLGAAAARRAAAVRLPGLRVQRHARARPAAGAARLAALHRALAAPVLPPSVAVL